MITQHTRTAGMFFTCLMVYAMIGTVTYRMGAAKWGFEPKQTVGTCWYLDKGTNKCLKQDNVHDGAAIAGVMWPVALPIMLGIVAGGKVTGVEQALAKSCGTEVR